MTVGIICEYNPLHLGHRKQILQIREAFGPDCTIVCAMSGNFVQRGSPAIIDKSARAKAAVLCGADLILELPVTVSLSSAEGFAAGGVKILSQMCDSLCFGAETAQADSLMKTASALLSNRFPPLLRDALAQGLSFPAARTRALEQMGQNADLLRQPNDILAVEYCKAILAQNSGLTIFPIHRQGSYHAEIADSENPSATSVRQLMLHSRNWRACVPGNVRSIFESAPLHSLASGERAMLAKLRTMTEEEFEALPYGSEGLWRKLMQESRRQASLEDILTAVKSKRYTRTRLDRMVMCAFLGITKAQLEAPAPYVRVLAFSDRGRTILSRLKKDGGFLNVGEKSSLPYYQLETRCTSLYGLFCADGPEVADAESHYRIFYSKN